MPFAGPFKLRGTIEFGIFVGVLGVWAKQCQEFKDYSLSGFMF